MKLTYQTAVAATIQFISLSVLGIANALDSIISTCHSDSGDCVSNMIVSIIFFILTVAWFAVILVLGYAAQERRSRRIAQVLIAAEAAIALVALFNAQHHTDILSLVTSLIDLCLAVWIITLAFRLMRARGGRVVTGRAGAGSQRPRRRQQRRRDD